MENQNGNPAVNPSSNTMIMSILSYMGLLVLIPYFMAKEDPKVKFHIKQGIVLVAILLVTNLFSMTMFGMFGFIGLINFFVVILSIIGIINVFQGQEKPLPIVGSLVSYIPESFGL